MFSVCIQNYLNNIEMKSRIRSNNPNKIVGKPIKEIRNYLKYDRDVF